MSSLISLFKSQFGQKQTSASLAKERLQIIIAREQSSTKKNFLPELEKELIAVISKYVAINEKDIKVSLTKDGTLEVLDVNIVIDGDSTK